MIIVSACLAGVNCKYNGGNNENEFVKKLVDQGKAIMVCPEQFGGLTTPRDPSEISCGKVFSCKGKDVTKEYNIGAKRACIVAEAVNAKIAILKAKSPSCGFGKIYDGSFSGKLINGNGVGANALFEMGIKIYTEKDLEKEDVKEIILSETKK